MRNVQHNNRQKNCKIDVRDDVANEFDDRRTSNSTVQRKRKIKPGGWTNQHEQRKGERLAERPVHSTRPNLKRENSLSILAHLPTSVR